MKTGFPCLSLEITKSMNSSRAPNAALPAAIPAMPPSEMPVDVLVLVLVGSEMAVTVSPRAALRVAVVRPAMVLDTADAPEAVSVFTSTVMTTLPLVYVIKMLDL